MDTTQTTEHFVREAAALADSGMPATATGRRDFYAPIHKALRLFMTRTLTAVGSADPTDAADVAAALAQVDSLVGIC